MKVNELLAICKEISYLENHIGDLTFGDLEKVTMQMRLHKLLNIEIGKIYCDEEE
jgi:hypothetical protein